MLCILIIFCFYFEFYIGISGTFSGFGTSEEIHQALEKILFLVAISFIPQDIAYNHHDHSVLCCIDLIGLESYCLFHLWILATLFLSFLFSDFYHFTNMETHLNLETLCCREKLNCFASL